MYRTFLEGVQSGSRLIPGRELARRTCSTTLSGASDESIGQVLGEVFPAKPLG